ncbi:MAG: DUF3418 domain-containing protein, partial [Gammaproteobacteria bacterium]
KDAQKLSQLAPLLARAAAAEPRLGPAERARLQFLLEEYRVSLFAPTLGTAEKVSAQRIDDFLVTARERFA